MTNDQSASEAGRVLAAKRRQATRNCAQCGSGFIAATTRRYCSAACRVKASRARKRARGATGPSDVSALLEHIHAQPPAGRLFDDSVELIRSGREVRTAQLTGEKFSEARFAIESLHRQRELNERHGWAHTAEGTEILRELREAR